MNVKLLIADRHDDLRRVFSGLLVPIFTFLAMVPAVAKEKPAAKKPALATSALSASHTVVVPYDHTKPISEQAANHYYLDYETFQKLWGQAKTFRENGRKIAEDGNKGPEDFVISSALYRIHSTRDRLTVEGQLSVMTRGKTWQKVPLKFAGVNISSIELDGAAASFSEGAILIEKPGRHEVFVNFELPLDDRNQAATWSIPQASATLLEIEMDSEFAEPVLQNNWPMAEVKKNRVTSQLDDTGNTASSGKVYLAALGQQEKIEFRRRLKTSGRGMTQPNVATIGSHLFVSSGLERLETTYKLSFQGQEENAFTIEFDESITPVQFEIPNLQSWRMLNEKPGVRSLRFELTQPVRDELEVKMIGERLAATMGETRNFPEMGANAARVVQIRSIVRVSDLDVAISPGSDHRQVEFVKSGVDLAGFVPVASYSLANGNDSLAYVLSERESNRSATVEYVFQAGRGKLETVGQFQLRSPDSPLLSATITLPGDGTIQSVGGNRVRDWWRSGNELFVRFSGPTPEVTALLVYIAQELDTDATEMTVSPFGLSGFSEEDVSGSGLVVTHVTQDTVVNFDQSRQVVREVGADEVLLDFEVLAPLERKRGLRFERGNFSGTVRLSPISAKFDSTWVMLARAHESWLDLSIRADLEITRSAVDRVRFSTAESVPEFRVISDDVREVKSEIIDGRREYEVRFQTFVTDAIYFNLETEIPHAGTGTLPDLVFADASRQSRYLIVENRSSDRMALEHSGVQPTVESLLPYTPATLLSADLFRAPTADWNVDVSIEKLETSAGNQASIAYAELTTAFRANGEEWVKASYHLQNRSLQFLPVDLPEGAELISVRVAQNDVRADRGEVDGRTVALVPLIQTKPGQLAYDVELVFRNRDGITKDRKTLDDFSRRLDDPEIVGVSVEKTLWNVYLPEGHQLEEAEGNMDRVQAEKNALEKLRTDLAELETLNYLAGDDDNAVTLRNFALQNGSSLASQLEEKLGGISTNDAEVQQLKQGLEKQKLIITENRIEMPKFDTRQADNINLDLKPEAVDFDGFINYGESISETKNGKVAQKGKVTWGDNAEEFETRNLVIQKKEEAQKDKVGKQVRLNDSISLGNKYFNNDASAYAVQEGQVKKNDVERGKTVADQNSKLSSTSTASNEVDEKLNILSYAQIGHGGFQGANADGFADDKVNVGGGFQGGQMQGNQTVNSSNFIQLEGQNDTLQQQVQRPNQMQAEPSSQQQQELSQTYTNARSSLSKKKGAVMPTKPVSGPAPVDPFAAPPSTNQPAPTNAPGGGPIRPDAQGGGGGGAVVVTPAGDAFRASGRQSVSVNFPVEGMVYHFQKLKDHAEITIDSGRPTDWGRGIWLLLMLIYLSLLSLGYVVAGRIRRERRS